MHTALAFNPVFELLLQTSAFVALWCEGVKLIETIGTGSKTNENAYEKARKHETNGRGRTKGS